MPTPARAPQTDEIRVPGMTDNETWLECPDCHRTWKQMQPTPGLLHTYVRCFSCTERESRGRRC